MNFPVYPVDASEDRMLFRFYSEGPKGIIEKRVQFEKYPWKTWYNLILGDVDDKGQLKFEVSGNEDMKVIMATVAYIIDKFLSKYPDRVVILQGTDTRRILLYGRIIREHMLDFFPGYTFHGLIDASTLLHPILLHPKDPNIAFCEMFTVQKTFNK
ncbi:hypothetical protein GCM10028806_34030 [Spirosoma terrae]|uniref:Uncharacterized protein n=1 Tax=Spirosoma terrae TaxID=1968276 RepID=A0A6L9L590_9BACT|nr:hypothetical protein [Spirosoma terrae]NDU95716.1 hypothetical protein [Spirosoma terrae]